MASIIEKFENTKREEFSLTEDFTFKAVYGRGTPETNRALIDLLNVILKGTGEETIRSVKIRKPYIPGELKEIKESVLDVLAETDRNILVNIEMQVKDYISYPDRDLYYAGKVMATHALQRGYDYSKMKKTIMITIIDNQRYGNGKVRCPFSVLEEDTLERLSDKLKFFFIQLRAVDIGKPVEELSQIETFAAYIKYAGDKNKAGYIEKLLEHGKEYLTSSEIAFDEVVGSDTMYFEREKYYIKMSDNVTIAREMREAAEAEGRAEGLAKGRAEGRAEGIAEGRKEGIAEGRKEGIAKGLEEGRREGKREGRAEGERIGEARGEQAKQNYIISNMFAKGLDIKLIAELTGLTEEEVNALNLNMQKS